ncbi:MAG: hypothetical protein CSB55_03540 [Candidatus Cloacimonadota bacterium]|nr:MAG: hypothetical protein CSB55_03540 [Candidatus Cloacimonadota bacterium]
MKSKIYRIAHKIIPQKYKNNITLLLYRIRGIKIKRQIKYAENYDLKFSDIENICGFDHVLPDKYLIFDKEYSLNDLPLFCEKNKFSSGDIKDFREFSRLYFLLSLALCNRTKLIKEIFSARLKTDIFLWENAMETAIRAVNLSVTFQLIKNKLSAKEQKTWMYRLFSCGIYIRNNLEKMPGNSNNHYLFDLLGLIWLGVNFKNNEIADEWTDFAVKEFEKEINLQFYQDGFSYEGSTNYLFEEIEIFLLAEIALMSSDRNFSFSFKEKFKKIRKTAFAFTFSDGSHANIGDTDSGKILWLDWNEPKNNLTPLFTLLKACYPDDDIPGFKPDENSGLFRLFSFGLKKTAYIENDRSLFFPDINAFIRKKQNNSLIFWGGAVKNEPLFAEHKHSDINQILLELDGSQIFTDSGSFRYNPVFSVRRSFVEEEAHNTVKFAESQRDFKDAFHKKNRKIKFEYLEKSNDKIKTKVCFKNVIWTREIINDNFNNISIIDEVDQPGNIYFILHPDIKIERVSDNVLIFKSKNNNYKFKSEEKILILYHEISYEYGKKIGTRKLICNLNKKNKCFIARV